jgi:hypothetical protein
MELFSEDCSVLRILDVWFYTQYPQLMTIPYWHNPPLVLESGLHDEDTWLNNADQASWRKLNAGTESDPPFEL